MLRRCGPHPVAWIVLAAVVLAAGCGGDDGGTAAESGPPKAAAPVTEPASAAPQSSAADDAPPVPVEPAGTGGAPAAGAEPAGPIPVELRTADGEMLTAAQFGAGGPAGVVLGHMRNAGKEVWFPLAQELAARGVVALAIDFRGYGGSTGERDTQLDVDYAAAVEHLRALGVGRVVLAGASMGGTGAIVAAADPALGVDAVVSVSGPAEFGRLDAAAVAGDLGIPALFVVAEDDEPYAGDARVLAGAAGGELVVVPGSAHGTALFDDAPDALSAFLDFVTP